MGRINSGTAAYIIAHGICKRVVNSSGSILAIPIKYSSEWESFRNHSIPGVTKDNKDDGGGDNDS
jgi:hypothetical protein